MINKPLKINPRLPEDLIPVLWNQHFCFFQIRAKGSIFVQDSFV